MSLNQSDNLFLSLVRYAVSSKCDDSSAFSGKDWTEIIKMSYSQAIPVLVIDGLQNYLKSNPNSNPFTNETVAEKLNVNSSYLSTLFHREYGCTLTDFVNKERIDRGILLLQMTTKPIQDIAADCGIQDVNYFIKLFKKQTGFTPKQYRETAGR